MVRRHPVVIIGSPRSGTTIITRVLETLGLFVGEDLATPVHESGTFKRLNAWIIRHSGGTVYRPEPVRELLRNPEARDLAREFLRERIFSTKEAGRYMGRERYRRCGSLDGLDVPWGWKDPGTTFTLPLWLELFPSARVIHVCRHGVDVASSLMEFFGVTGLEQMHRNYEVGWRRSRRLVYRIRKRLRLPTNIASEQRLCSSHPDGAFAMWESYIAEGRRHLESLGDRGCQVRYENLTSDPSACVLNLAEFCGLSKEQELIERASRLVRPRRDHAYEAHPSLRAFAETVEDRLKLYGYSPAGHPDASVD